MSKSDNVANNLELAAMPGTTHETEQVNDDSDLRRLGKKPVLKVSRLLLRSGSTIQPKRKLKAMTS